MSLARSSVPRDNLLVRRSALRSLGLCLEGKEVRHPQPQQITRAMMHGLSLVIAGLDPAIHLLRKKMDARVKPARDEEKKSRGCLTL